MPKLWLTFKDDDGEQRRVEVDRGPFTIGRHSECDLSVLDSRLSREHLRIESHAGTFTAEDKGSSNGTTINGRTLVGPVELRDGDRLDLGGGLEIVIQLEADEPVLDAAPPPPAPGPGAPQFETAAAAPRPAASGSPAASGGGIPTAFFIIGPLLGLFVLVGVIGALVLLGGDKEVARNIDDTDEPYIERPSPRKDDEPDEPKPEKSPVATDSPTGPIATSSPANSGPGPLTPVETGDTAKVERSGAAFVRQIAQNDPKAFLTGEQASRVNAKIKQISRSAALADNLNSLRKNAMAIKSLAAQKNLKPQFLGIAALTRLGSSRGDVLQAVQSVAEVYGELRIQIGNENFDDALLMVAAYDQGAAGETMKMRNMLQTLAQQPGSPGSREIRSIWYLQRSGKITEAEYDRALSFLAIGTIAQNPKDFGVNAEALRL